MSRLLIIGAGGHGKCCLDIARSMNQFDAIHFLDDRNAGDTVNDARVIGTVDEMDSYRSEYENIFIAVGNNETRKKLMKQAEAAGYNPVSLISPYSTVSSYCDIGKGTAVFPNAVIEPAARIGEGCIISANSTVHHDAVIEDYTLIYSNCVIRPYTTIGKHTTVPSGKVMTGGKQDV